jgi:lipid-A-disaccharide synthase
VRLFISAGEVSGDIVAARLVQRLRAHDPCLEVDAIGGDHLEAAGASLLSRATHIGAIGVSEGLAVAPSAVRIFRDTVRHCRECRPDLAILIGNDIFNVLLGRRLRAHGIRTVGYFPPQTWIWAAIARLFAPSFDRILSSFPDETRCYQRVGVHTEFVGHYLADLLPVATTDERLTARAALGLQPDRPVVALLPGSRQQERQRLLPVLLETVDHLQAAMPDVQCIFVDTHVTGALQTPAGHSVKSTDDSHLAMRAADAGILCSGTATLEAALIGLPMVVAYRSSRITYAIVRTAIALRLIHDDTVALPNLIAGERVVREFVQSRLSARALSSEVLALLASADRREPMISAFQRVRQAIALHGSLDRAASIILEHARQPCHT